MRTLVTYESCKHQFLVRGLKERAILLFSPDPEEIWLCPFCLNDHWKKVPEKYKTEPMPVN